MRISVIGSGAVATHLSAAFANAGHRIVQVWSRNPEHAALLAYYVKAEVLTDLHQIDGSVDMVLIAVKDDTIAAVVSQLPPLEAIIVHTSGSTALSMLKGASANTGVFYPLQTFSRGKEVDIQNVPLLIEGNSEGVLVQLHALASSISSKVIKANSEQRLSLHVAAVFACNFSNYLYTLSKMITDHAGLDFNLLHPLIAETTDKALQDSPADVQTGPAVRNDRQIIENHIQYLAYNKELQEVYQLMSQGIINFHLKR